MVVLKQFHENLHQCYSASVLDLDQGIPGLVLPFYGYLQVKVFWYTIHYWQMIYKKVMQEIHAPKRNKQMSAKLSQVKWTSIACLLIWRFGDRMPNVFIRSQVDLTRLYIVSWSWTYSHGSSPRRRTSFSLSTNTSCQPDLRGSSNFPSIPNICANSSRSSW